MEVEFQFGSTSYWYLLLISIHLFEKETEVSNSILWESFPTSILYNYLCEIFRVGCSHRVKKFHCCVRGRKRREKSNLQIAELCESADGKVGWIYSSRRKSGRRRSILGLGTSRLQTKYKSRGNNDFYIAKTIMPYSSWVNFSSNRSISFDFMV